MFFILFLFTCCVKNKGDTELGERIRELRKEYGITQEKLAEAAECTPRHLSKIENAQVDPAHSIVENIIHNGFKISREKFYQYPVRKKKKKDSEN